MWRNFTWVLSVLLYSTALLRQTCLCRSWNTGRLQCILGRHFTKELASQMLYRTSTVHNIKLVFFYVRLPWIFQERDSWKAYRESKPVCYFQELAACITAYSQGCPQARSSHGCWDGWVRVPETRKRERSPTQHDFYILNVKTIAFSPSSSSYC